MSRDRGESTATARSTTRIVAHEWGHYISQPPHRRRQRPQQQPGRRLGEGWGDFHALLMMVREADALDRRERRLRRRLRRWPATSPRAARTTATTSASAACPYSTDFSEEPAHLQAHRRRRARCPPPRRSRSAPTARQLRGPQRRRGLGDDAVGVLRGAAARHLARRLTFAAGAGPDEALPGGRLQAHAARCPPSSRRATRCSRRSASDATDYLRCLRRLREARHGPGRGRSRQPVARQHAGGRELLDRHPVRLGGARRGQPGLRRRRHRRQRARRAP